MCVGGRNDSVYSDQRFTLANLTLQHTGTTPPIDQAQWEGDGAHRFNNTVPGSVMVVDSANAPLCLAPLNGTLLGKTVGNMTGIAIGGSGVLANNTLSFNMWHGQFPFLYVGASDPGAGEVKLYTGGSPNQIAIDTSVIDLSAMLLAAPVNSILWFDDAAGNTIVVQTTSAFVQVGPHQANVVVLYDSGIANNTSVLLSIAYAGAQGIAGANGTNGAAGPNQVTSATTTDLTGIFAGNGTAINVREIQGANCTVENGNGSLDNPLIRVPQDISTTAEPSFANTTLTGQAGSGSVISLLDSNGKVIRLAPPGAGNYTLKSVDDSVQWVADA